MGNRAPVKQPVYGISLVVAAIGLLLAGYVLCIVLIATTTTNSRPRFWSEEAMSAFFFVGPVSLACLFLYLLLSCWARSLRRGSTWIIAALWLALGAFTVLMGGGTL